MVKAPVQPDSSAAPARAGEVLRFDFDRATIRASDTIKLDALVAQMRDRGYRHVLIKASTDPIGSAAYNQRLSERRAMAVKSHLVSQGIDPARIEAVGEGERFQVTLNRTPQERQENRRAMVTVEFLR
jgi:outer membrane protein OmpA-like peptidoglycan-associated protein